MFWFLLINHQKCSILISNARGSLQRVIKRKNCLFFGVVWVILAALLASSYSKYLWHKSWIKMESLKVVVCVHIKILKSISIFFHPHSLVFSFEWRKKIITKILSVIANSNYITTIITFAKELCFCYFASYYCCFSFLLLLLSKSFAFVDVVEDVCN